MFLIEAFIVNDFFFYSEYGRYVVVDKLQIKGETGF